MCEVTKACYSLNKGLILILAGWLLVVTGCGGGGAGSTGGGGFELFN
ncbi:MAG: hypothetical protein HYR67_00630 [Bacteroidetes bacterium]|nr:hypothetical protein [Bacteroidota bacterium]